MMYERTFAAGLFLLASACSEEVGDKNTPEGAGGGGGGAVDTGRALSFDVPESGRVFVRLATPEVVTPEGDGASSMDWDLAFSGLDVFTNSGLSGLGRGGALPLDLASYESGEVPDNVILLRDDAGGAFASWYAYDPEGGHVLWSRYHIYGVKRGERTWKAQILGFYGEAQGAPVTALYTVRYAEVSRAGSGATVDLAGIDATAGGREAPETEPSACLDLASGQVLRLTPAEAGASTAWDLCFRRASVSVNGELGGPGGVSAADLDAAKTRSEELAEVKMRTAGSEAARFDATGFAELTDSAVVYRGDRVVTAFSDRWLEPGASPLSPVETAAWLVQGADGESRFVLVFDRFEGASASSPGRITMRVKQVQ